MAGVREMISTEKILEGINKMPPLSTTVTKVVEVANNMQSTPNELSAVIKMDPVLTAKVMKLVNSAYFSLPDQVTSLNRAIILLGLNTIKNLALSAAVLGQFGSTNHKSFDMSKYWKYCLAVAVASKKIAKKLGVAKRNLEEFFMAGMLHDIGMVVVVQLFPDKVDPIMEKAAEGLPFAEVERDVMGLTCSEIGATLARHWKIGENMTTVIEEFNEPNIVGDFAQLVCAVHVASIYCLQNGYGLIETEVLPPADEVTGKLGITYAEVQAELAELGEDVEKASTFLQTASGS